MDVCTDGWTYGKSKYVQKCQNRFKNVKMYRKKSKWVQICPNRSKQVQVGSNRSSQVQIVKNSSKQVSTDIRTCICTNVRTDALTLVCPYIPTWTYLELLGTSWIYLDSWFHNGSYWCKMVQKGTELYKQVQTSQKWSKIFQYDPIVCNSN